MISYVLCDNQDTLTAFGLSGIQGQLFDRNQDFLKTIHTLIEKKDIGLMLISQNIYDEFIETLSYEMLQKKQTLFIPIPGPKEAFSTSFKDYMKGIAGVKK